MKTMLPICLFFIFINILMICVSSDSIQDISTQSVILQSSLLGEFMADGGIYSSDRFTFRQQEYIHIVPIIDSTKFVWTAGPSFPPGISFVNGTISGYSYLLMNSTKYTVKATSTSTSYIHTITMEILYPVCISEGNWPETVSGTTAILECPVIPLGKQYRDCIYDNNDFTTTHWDSVEASCTATYIALGVLLCLPILCIIICICAHLQMKKNVHPAQRKEIEMSEVVVDSSSSDDKPVDKKLLKRQQAEEKQKQKEQEKKEKEEEKERKKQEEKEKKEQEKKQKEEERLKREQEKELAKAEANIIKQENKKSQKSLFGLFKSSKQVQPDSNSSESATVSGVATKDVMPTDETTNMNTATIPSNSTTNNDALGTQEMKPLSSITPALFVGPPVGDENSSEDNDERTKNPFDKSEDEDEDEGAGNPFNNADTDDEEEPPAIPSKNPFEHEEEEEEEEEEEPSKNPFASSNKEDDDEEEEEDEGAGNPFNNSDTDESGVGNPFGSDASSEDDDDGVIPPPPPPKRKDFLPEIKPKTLVDADQNSSIAFAPTNFEDDCVPDLPSKPIISEERHLPTHVYNKNNYATNYPSPPLPMSSSMKLHTIQLPKTYHFETLHNGSALPSKENKEQSKVTMSKTKELLKPKKMDLENSKVKSRSLPPPPPPRSLSNIKTNKTNQNNMKMTTISDDDDDDTIMNIKKPRINKTMNISSSLSPRTPIAENNINIDNNSKVLDILKEDETCKNMIISKSNIIDEIEIYSKKTRRTTSATMLPKKISVYIRWFNDTCLSDITCGTFKEAQQQLTSYLYPYLARCHGYIYNSESSQIGLIFESQPKTLQDYLQNPELKIEISQILTYIKHVLSGLLYIHKKGKDTCHGDIRPSNILLSGSKAFLTDYASSIIQFPTGSLSMLYVPPEAYKINKPTQAGDIFTLSKIFIDFIATNNKRFASIDADTILLSQTMVTTLRRAIAPNPISRPSCKDLLEQFKSL